MPSHIDTVPPYFGSTEDDVSIYGRGSVDAKGQIAPQILAVRNLRARGAIADGDVSFLYVVGEEVDHAGMKFANQASLQGRAGIVRRVPLGSPARASAPLDTAV